MHLHKPYMKTRVYVTTSSKHTFNEKGDSSQQLTALPVDPIRPTQHKYKLDKNLQPVNACAAANPGANATGTTQDKAPAMQNGNAVHAGNTTW